MEYKKEKGKSNLRNMGEKYEINAIQLILLHED